MQGEDTISCIIRMARCESLVRACIGVCGRWRTACKTLKVTCSSNIRYSVAYSA